MKAYGITLRRSPEVWAGLVREDWPFEVERFYGVDGREVGVPKGWTQGEGAWGCLLSHVAVWTEMVRTGVSEAVVLEDDARQTEWWPEAWAARQSLPDGWDMYYLGGQHLSREKKTGKTYADPKPHPSGLYRCGNVHRTHGYLLTRKAAGMLLRGVLGSLNVAADRWHVDHRMGDLHASMAVYAPPRWGICQEARHSTVCNRRASRKVFKHTIEVVRPRKEPSAVRPAEIVVNGPNAAWLAGHISNLLGKPVGVGEWGSVVIQEEDVRVKGLGHVLEVTGMAVYRGRLLTVERAVANEWPVNDAPST